MTPAQRLKWAEEMMILGWEVQARLAAEREAKNAALNPTR
jgi:hypothetical protein